jgi:hypothetical protein
MQLASVAGKHGNEFIFQGHQFAGEGGGVFVKLSRNSTFLACAKAPYKRRRQ